MTAGKVSAFSRVSAPGNVAASCCWACFMKMTRQHGPSPRDRLSTHSEHPFAGYNAPLQDPGGVW